MGEHRSEDIQMIVLVDESGAGRNSNHNAPVKCNVGRLFESFDVRDATCHLDEDTKRLHAIIDDGFGGFARFNAEVRKMFSSVGTSPLGDEV